MAERGERLWRRKSGVEAERQEDEASGRKGNRKRKREEVRRGGLRSGKRREERS